MWCGCFPPTTQRGAFAAGQIRSLATLRKSFLFLCAPLLGYAISAFPLPVHPLPFLLSGLLRHRYAFPWLGGSVLRLCKAAHCFATALRLYAEPFHSGPVLCLLLGYSVLGHCASWQINTALCFPPPIRINSMPLHPPLNLAMPRISIAHPRKAVRFQSHLWNAIP